MKKSIYTLFSCLILFSSCKKTALPEDENTTNPLFYIKCNINGLPVELSAGANDYYMSSSHYLDTNHVYVYKAELTQKNCSNNCGYSISVLINDNKISSLNSAPDVNGTVKVGDYVFYGSEQDPLFYQAKFTPAQPSSGANRYVWLLNDTMRINTYEANIKLVAGKKYSMKFISDGKCSTQHSNVFDLGSPLQTLFMASRVPTTKDPMLKYEFVSNATGKAPYSYQWDFGDGAPELTSTDASTEHVYAEQGRYTAKVKVVDADNNTCISYYQVAAFYEYACDANYTTVFAPVPNPKVFSAITILIADANGNVYSSKDIAQPSNSSFKITEVEEYKTNENGEPTKKIKIKFNCMVNDGGNKINISNGEAVMAVSYK